MKAFKLLHGAFMLADAAVLSRLPPSLRQRAFALAARSKRRLFRDAPMRSVAPPDGPSVTGVPRGPASMRLPSSLLADIADVRRSIDPTLYEAGMPRAGSWQRVYPKRPGPGRAYLGLAERLPSRPTHILVVPCLRKGGVDLCVLRHLAVLASDPTARPALVTTDMQPSTWLGRLPPGVAVAEVGPATADLSPMERRLVLTRLLMQGEAHTLHVVNSRLGLEAVALHGKAMRRSARIFLSFYCDDDLLADGVPRGFAHDFIQACDPNVDGYISDNRAYPGKLAALYGVDPGKFHPLRMPTEPVPPRSPAPGSKRILWAGRLDRQKRPDLLLEIARACPDLTFDVWGTAVMDGGGALASLRKQANVALRGPYDGFDAIPTDGYAAFLYTSLWDGLPNVLLEAGARGLPVVASGVGGVGELISPATGWCVDPDAGADGYAGALRQAISTGEGAERGASLREVVGTHHGMEAFAVALAGIPGYLRPWAGPPASGDARGSR